MTKTRDHDIHQYIRVKWGAKETIVYRCQKPGCNHYVLPEFLPGKLAECPVCHKPFEVNLEISRLRRPHCSECKLRVFSKKQLAERVPESVAKSPEEIIKEFRKKFGG